MRTLALLRPLAALALALAAPAAAHAQRDTIRLGGEPAPHDTISLAAPDTAPQPGRPARWSQPFAVEGSGEVAPRPPAREVVWLSADSVRARRLAARRDSAATDEADALAAADSSAGTESADSAPPPARRGSRTASRDTAAAPRRGRGTAPRDTADTRTTRRSTARDTAAAATRRTASRDTAAARRASSRDTATARRGTSRDTARARTTAGRPRTHTVAAGETLYGIARRYGVTTAQIRALNPDLGETLEVGTTLRLPAGARAPGQAARSDDEDRPAPRRSSADDEERPATRRTADRDAAPRPSTRARRHTVAAGETLYGLARRYGVSVDAIRRANRLESDTVRPGQVLTIPAAPAPDR